MTTTANARAPGKPIRCAIYTRKSTEEGLEQAFNSLDAQREACAAYIASQKHEGWVASPELYDDGGFSGGNMNRPGLAALMAEVNAGRIQVIVVYKVDRLTRSLADFAKIVEVLDARGASFVSVTQSFNTTTSMGRLTLNVLLSFAQFEREVTGERIRDKIAASKRKGMWMGGPVPLGYDVRDRKLVINEAEAATVRHIFERYLVVGTAQALLDELGASGVRTKATMMKSGQPRGGIVFARGTLLHLLGNRVYLGETRHRDQHYPGEHEAIVPAALWRAVQAHRAGNRVTRTAERNIGHPSLLAGLVFDGHGRRMTPNHACKGARRYRYYVTAPDLVTSEQPAWRVPAHDLEALVTRRLIQMLADCIVIQQAIAAVVTLDASALANALDNARQLAADIAEDPAASLPLVTSIALHLDRVEIDVDLAKLLAGLACNELQEPAAISHSIVAPAARIRRGLEVRLILANPGDVGAGQIDSALVGLIARAHAARQAMLALPDAGTAAIAANQNITVAYCALLLRLSMLAPDIIAAILSGRQPASLTRQKLARLTNLPVAWDQQRAMLGFTQA